MSQETLTTLERMARQIADYFRAYPEEQAVGEIAHHLAQFWSPQMRATFLAQCDMIDDPLIAKAAQRLRERGQ